jgi:hypothetical protein
MADPPTHSDSGTGPDDFVPTGAPRWVKMWGIITIALVLLVLIVMLASGGRHGPGRHLRFGEGGGHRPPSGSHP